MVAAGGSPTVAAAGGSGAMVAQRRRPCKWSGVRRALDGGRGRATESGCKNAFRRISRRCTRLGAACVDGLRGRGREVRPAQRARYRRRTRCSSCARDAMARRARRRVVRRRGGASSGLRRAFGARRARRRKFAVREVRCARGAWGEARARDRHFAADLAEAERCGKPGEERKGSEPSAPAKQTFPAFQASQSGGAGRSLNSVARAARRK